MRPRCQQGMVSPEAPPLVQTLPVPMSPHGRPCVPNRQDRTTQCRERTRGPRRGRHGEPWSHRNRRSVLCRCRRAGAGEGADRVSDRVSCDVTQPIWCLASHHPGPLGLQWPPHPQGTPGTPPSPRPTALAPTCQLPWGPHPARPSTHSPPSRRQSPLPSTSRMHYPRVEIAVPSEGDSGMGGSRAPH